MDNYPDRPMHYDMDYDMDDMWEIEDMYPELYQRMNPYAEDIVDMMAEDQIYAMTEADLNRMSDEVVVQASVNANMPVGHNPQTVKEAAKAVIANNIYNRRRRPFLFPFFPPFFYFPFDGRRRRHQRRDRYGRDRYDRY